MPKNDKISLKTVEIVDKLSTLGKIRKVKQAKICG
jgi:hypothetical protein